MSIPTNENHATGGNRCVSPFPDLGGLYLLIAGIVLGVLLGPAVLGRLAPSTYQDAFVGGADIIQQLADGQAKLEQQLTTLQSTGVTDAALPEQALQAQQQEVILLAQLQKAQQDHLASLAGWTTALMLAVIAVMMLESLLSPDPRTKGPLEISPAPGRLITARYALCALWITIMLAQPQLLAQLPILFAGLLIIVSLATALLPLGPKPHPNH